MMVFGVSFIIRIIKWVFSLIWSLVRGVFDILITAWPIVVPVTIFIIYMVIRRMRINAHVNAGKSEKRYSLEEDSIFYNADLNEYRTGEEHRVNDDDVSENGIEKR